MTAPSTDEELLDAALGVGTGDLVKDHHVVHHLVEQFGCDEAAWIFGGDNRVGNEGHVHLRRASWLVLAARVRVC
ncbi:hypothetical protein [Actinomadura sp.]|uniref:hypothetical protein n=1 Tax=Actinomadura sp. TaxID=1989 RepID=UPI0037C76E3F